MSAPARWAIAIACLLFAAATAALPFTEPAAGVRPLGIAATVAYLLLIVVACFPGPLRGVAGRLIGLSVFAACAAYVVIEVREPLPPLGTFLKTYRQSDTNIVNAVLAFCTFGLPAGCLALRGLLPDWSMLGERGHAQPDDDDSGSE